MDEKLSLRPISIRFFFHDAYNYSDRWINHTGAPWFYVLFIIFYLFLFADVKFYATFSSTWKLTEMNFNCRFYGILFHTKPEGDKSIHFIQSTAQS